MNLIDNEKLSIVLGIHFTQPTNILWVWRVVWIAIEIHRNKNKILLAFKRLGLGLIELAIRTNEGGSAL